MTRDVFPQNVIALIWDFDKTLIPGYMQAPLFQHFGVDEQKFWNEVNGLPDFQRNRGLDLVSPETVYLNHILTYVRAEKFKGLNNRFLVELGGQIEFFEGLPEFFQVAKDLLELEKYKRFEISLEHYIVSTGLRKMIEGSEIAPFVDFIWACEFVSDFAEPGYLDDPTKYDNALDQASLEELYEASAERTFRDIGYVIDNTAKTRAIFDINKGTNKEPAIKVNMPIDERDRRVPFANMIYIADGPSDVPVFSVVQQSGGFTFAVFPRGDSKALKQVDDLLKYNRIDAFGEADYSERSTTHLWIKQHILAIADKIVTEKEQDLRLKVGPIPQHLIEENQRNQ